MYRIAEIEKLLSKHAGAGRKNSEKAIAFQKDKDRSENKAEKGATDSVTRRRDRVVNTGRSGIKRKRHPGGGTGQLTLKSDINARWR